MQVKYIYIHIILIRFTFILTLFLLFAPSTTHSRPERTIHRSNLRTMKSAKFWLQSCIANSEIQWTQDILMCLVIFVFSIWQRSIDVTTLSELWCLWLHKVGGSGLGEQSIAIHSNSQSRKDKSLRSESTLSLLHSLLSSLRVLS